tara:strand:+ start:124 stop:243 length:120 start_codon:yes stop_codon:yes gene_type:complete
MKALWIKLVCLIAFSNEKSASWQKGTSLRWQLRVPFDRI